MRQMATNWDRMKVYRENSFEMKRKESQVGFRGVTQPFGPMNEIRKSRFALGTGPGVSSPCFLDGKVTNRRARRPCNFLIT